MADNLQQELQNIGLDKNEAAVYLSALELGASPVQKIAKRAGVPRATTYLVLRALKNQGLILTHEQGKKVFFTASHPSELEHVLVRREHELQVQKHALDHILPDLEQRGQFLDSARPRVRYYEGKEAFKAYRRDLLSKRKDQKLVRAVTDLTGLQKLVPDIYSTLTQKRIQEGVASRIISSDPGKKYGPHHDEKERRERREIIDNKAFPLPADVSIIGTSVGLMPYEEPFRAVIIDDPDIAQTLISLFELAWQGIEQGGATKKNKA